MRTNYLIAIIIVLLVAYWAKLQIVKPSHDRLFINNVTIPITNLPSHLNGTVMVQLTDLHIRHDNSPLLENMVFLTNSIQPDLILLTGDYINHDPQPIHSLAKILTKLRAKVPNRIYSILGNHDIAAGERAKAEVIRALERINIPVIENKHVYPFGPGVALVGLGDLWSPAGTRDVKQDFKPRIAFADIPADIPRIVLSHNPDSAEDLANYRADLILSGHTHGGAVQLPFFGPLLPYFNWLCRTVPDYIRVRIPYHQHHNVIKHVEWIDGVHSIQRVNEPSKNNILHISRGVGTHTGIRFHCDPEINVITLISA